MEKKVIKSAKTVELAVKAALEELGADEDSVVIEVIDEGEAGGLLGFGRRAAQVAVSLAEDAFNDEEDNYTEPKTMPKEVDNEALAAAEKIALDYVTDILKGVGIHGQIGSYIDEDNTVAIEVTGEDCGAVIGHHGETLNAIQYLTNLAVNKNVEDYTRISLDIGYYKRRRKEKLIKTAERFAEKVAQGGKAYRMAPLSAAERRVVHCALQDHPEVETYSEGMDPKRSIVIIPKN